MAFHLFHTSGPGGYTVIVEASSEIEARGKMQKQLPSGVSPMYKGNLEELVAEEDGVLKV